jgi:hypothetical protein
MLGQDDVPRFAAPARGCVERAQFAALYHCAHAVGADSEQLGHLARRPAALDCI